MHSRSTIPHIQFKGWSYHSLAYRCYYFCISRFHTTPRSRRTESTSSEICYFIWSTWAQMYVWFKQAVHEYVHTLRQLMVSIWCTWYSFLFVVSHFFYSSFPSFLFVFVYSRLNAHLPPLSMNHSNGECLFLDVFHSWKPLWPERDYKRAWFVISCIMYDLFSLPESGVLINM